MIVRGVSRAIAGLALVLAVSACDDNPLAEDRDVGDHFRLNPSDVVVNTGGTVKIDATVLNRYGAATNDPVSSTPCDNKITAVADTGRSDFEFPERFVISGLTFGESCLIVTGGGLTDTIAVRVVPATVDVSLAAPGDTIVVSGESIVLPVALLSEGGSAAPGVTFDERTELEVTNSAIGDVSADGTFEAHAPGLTYIRATFTDLGVTRVDSVLIEVDPAPFTGTIVRSAYSGGETLTFSGHTFPFDADTRVEYTVPGSGDIVHLRPNTTTSVRGALPFGLLAGDTIEYHIYNADPQEGKVWGGYYILGADVAEEDSWGAAVEDPLTAPLMTEGVDQFGTINGDRTEIYYRFVVPTEGDYTLRVDWNDNSDIDVFIRDIDEDEVLAEETSGNPEEGTETLEPGTYYVHLHMFEAATAGETYYRVRLTRED